MLGSTQDAEDVLQDVFASAHAAILGDGRAINVRPWLYRIARNRCLNHLRRPVAEGQDSMDVHPHENGTSTLDRVQRREQLREIVADVQELPETQRTALLLREIDDLSYGEIAEAMDTTLPSVKSLLVRARMSLAEMSEGRVLSCDDVRLELAEAAEGLHKVSGPARHHVRKCSACRRYRSELRSSSRALAGLAPFGLFALARDLIPLNFGGGSAAGGTGGSAGAAGGSAGAGAAGGAAAAGTSGATLGGAAAMVGGAASSIGGALGAKAAAGMATAALITAGAVGVQDSTDQAPSPAPPPGITTHQWSAHDHHAAKHHEPKPAAVAEEPAPATEPVPEETAPTTAPEPSEPAPPVTYEDPAAGDGATAGGSSSGDDAGAIIVNPPDPIPAPEPIPFPPPDPTTLPPAEPPAAG
jgi:RNA polymerase sigma factor (sigma-70 family)